jgi:hypothetical protein
MLRYLVAIISALVVFACVAIVVDRFPGFQTAKYLLLIVCPVVVIAVSRPWTVDIRHPNSRLVGGGLASYGRA